MATARLPLLVDVSQYAGWPATSGIQRVLKHVAQDWPGAHFEACFGFLEGKNFVTGPISDLGELIAAAFTGRIDAASLGTALRERTDRAVASDRVEASFAAYLLPEPTLRSDNLAVADRLVSRGALPTFFVYYDSLPLTHPQLYPRNIVGHVEVDRYNRVLAKSDNIAFISNRSRGVFEARIARRELANAVVLRPGADSLAPVDGDSAAKTAFVVVGTVEPRKRHREILDAFERLWAQGYEYELIVLGGAGWERPDVLERLRDLSHSGRVVWFERAADEDVRASIASCAGVVFTPRVEGYGLPAVEALWLGRPVIASADLPAFEELPASGQIRLEDVSAEAIATAVRTLAEPEKNAEYRNAARSLQLPTWRQFATGLENWLASTVDRP